LEAGRSVNNRVCIRPESTERRGDVATSNDDQSFFGLDRISGVAGMTSRASF
jgi:hypothetical protein